jgi:hypothetical protein
MRRSITMNARMLHHLTIACTMAIVALLWSPTTALSGEEALDAATIEGLAGVKGELSEKEGVSSVSLVPSGISAKPRVPSWPEPSSSLLEA